MKGLDPKRSSELFRSNSKKHFKMYKAGTKWLVAGISTLAGLLGMGSITSSAKADTTKASAAKTVDTEEVSATKTTGTIPATSQVSSQVTSTTTANTSTSTNETSTTSTAQTSTTDAASATTSTAANSDTTNSTSTATDQKTATASVSTNETSTTSTAQTSTTPAASTSTTTSTTSTKDETSVAASTSTAKTSTNDLTSNATASTTQTSGSTSMTTEASASASATASASNSANLATLLANTVLTQANQNKVAMMAEAFSLTEEETLSLVNALSTPKVYGDENSYNKGIADATTDINNLISSIAITTASLANNYNVLNILNPYAKYLSGIGAHVEQLSNLFTDYDTDSSLQASTGQAAPTWHGDAYQAKDASDATFQYTTTTTSWGGLVTNKTQSTLQTKDYNQGYSDYARDFVEGIYTWLDGVAAQAKNPDTANSLLDTQTYDPAALSGDSSAGSTGSATGSALGTLVNQAVKGEKYAPDVLSFSNITGNIANSSISSATNALNLYIELVAPNLINGIAKQALSDVRSIGGTLDDGDYTPQTLTEAVALNAGTQSMLAGFGMSSLVGTSLFQHIYEALADNAKAAIENSWAIGEAAALKGFLQDDGQIYDGASESPYKAKVTNYSETDPAVILSSSGTLSTIAEAAGYAWTQKVIGNVMTIANVDALGGTEKTNITEIINQLVTNGKLTTDEANQVLNRNSATGETNENSTGVAHVFDANNSALDYVRNGSGAQEVIEQLYNAEYKAAKAALTDYGLYPNMTDAELAANQAEYTYDNPAYANLATKHDPLTVGVYTQLMHALWINDASYRGMMAADNLVHATATGNAETGVGNNPANIIAAVSTTTGKTIAPEDAGTLTVDNAVLTSVSGKSPRAFATNILGSTAYGQLPDFVRSSNTSLYKSNTPDNMATEAQEKAMGAYMNQYVTEAYDRAYAEELALATRAFNDGKALAEQQYEESTNGQIPDVTAAGSYNGHSATDDATGVAYVSQANYHNRTQGNVWGNVYPGRLLKDGYNLNLVTVAVATAKDPSASQADYNNTTMANYETTTVNTLSGKSVTITAPVAQSGWSVSSANPLTLDNVTADAATAKTTAETAIENSPDKALKGNTSGLVATFEYTQIAGFNDIPLADATMSYNTQDASSQLPDSQVIYPSWNTGVGAEGTEGAQAYTISKSDLTVDNDGAKVGQYAYHLTTEGAQKLLDFITGTLMEGQTPEEAGLAAPTVASLMAMTGTISITQTTDPNYLPTINAHNITTYTDNPVRVISFVDSATSADGKTDLTGKVVANTLNVDWNTVGYYPVTLTLTDPTSNQTVTKTVYAIVVTPEASTSAIASQSEASTSAETSASEAASTSTIKSQSLSGSASSASESDTSISEASLSLSQEVSASEDSLSEVSASVSASATSTSEQSKSDDSTLASASASEASMSQRNSEDQSQLSVQSQSAASLSEQSQQSVASQNSEISESLASVSEAQTSDDSISASLKSLSEASESQASQDSEQSQSQDSAKASASASQSQSAASAASQSVATSESIQKSLSVEDSRSVSTSVSLSQSVSIASQSIANSESESASNASQSNAISSTSAIVSAVTSRNTSLSLASQSQESEASDISASMISQSLMSESVDQSELSKSLTSVSEASASFDSEASAASMSENSLVSASNSLASQSLATSLSTISASMASQSQDISISDASVSAASVSTSIEQSEAANSEASISDRLVSDSASESAIISAENSIASASNSLSQMVDSLASASDSATVSASDSAKTSASQSTSILESQVASQSAKVSAVASASVSASQSASVSTFNSQSESADQSLSVVSTEISDSDASLSQRSVDDGSIQASLSESTASLSARNSADESVYSVASQSLGSLSNLSVSNNQCLRSESIR